MKNQYKKSESRRKTPWDTLSCRTPVQELIKDVYNLHYQEKHESINQSGEVDFLNSLSPDSCPYCGSFSFTKKGLTANGTQRYLCKECNKRFTLLTGTIFEDHKLPIREWVEFLINLLHHTSLAADSRTNKNSYTTTRYWLQKVFLILEDYTDSICLDGDVYFDETYWSVSVEDIKLKEDGTKPRGLSTNKFCIAVAYNGKYIKCIVCGKGKPSSKRILNGFKDCIKPGSTLIHDGDNSHTKLIDELKLKSEVYPTKVTKKLPDKDNPLRPINEQHSLIKHFLRSHSGFDREDLSNYLNLYNLITNPPKNDLEKVEKLLTFSIEKKKQLSYRTFYTKK